MSYKDTLMNEKSFYVDHQSADRMLGPVDTTDANGDSRLGAPVRTYKFVADSVWSQRGHQIQGDDVLVCLWVRNKRGFPEGSLMDVHTGSENGIFAAVCSLFARSRKLRLTLGDRDSTDKDA
ncbi:hypothetical protein LTR53_015438 [Teratosphaeriaceae sp. CCFEE 6253]|nr:hypothetical protein LTR53_015438 [Teratosphaeriaceae sp. CCFEE 6253]